MRHKTAVLAVALLAIVGGGAYWYFNGGGDSAGLARVLATVGVGSGKKAAALPPPEPVGVEVAKVRQGPARNSVRAVGSFRSNESVILRPEVTSRITEFNFTEGQPVKKGQILVRLDSSLEEAMLVQAEASLALSRANFERAQSLITRQAGTEKSLDEARASLRRDEAIVLLTRTRIEKYTINAPFDGVIGLRRVSIGSYLAPGSDIVNLEQIDPIKVDFRVPEVFLAGLVVGQAIDVAVDAYKGRAFQGKVYAIDPLVDESGRAVVIRAQVDNPGKMLRPGVFARVDLTLSLRENALWVPEQAVVPVGDRVQVYKVVDGKSVPTFVKLGQRGSGDVEVVDGLQPDETVIVAGHVKLPPRPVPVRVVPPGGARQAASPPAPAGAAPAGETPAKQGGGVTPAQAAPSNARGG